MQIIAHRGASGTEPENTIRSFQKAESMGADMLELDVRKSADGELVVVHDHDMLRLFGDPRLIRDTVLSEIKRVSAEHGREIPTLDEVLAVIHTDLNIEIKVHGIEEQVFAKLKSFPHKVLISSFYPGVLKKFRTLDGNVQLGLIFAKGEWSLRTIISFLTRKDKLYSVNPQSTYVSYATMLILRLLAKKVLVWTVNDRHEYERMRKLGVDGIFTDYPELMKQFEKL
ncbi:MAG: glycerophosphodiester phosphodiesterase [Candidatus Doudnabacteria bacterium]|nr:glycerophosphodiester phosphodiesterase [Candidatus Doudnabacteria bacterium]